MEATARAVAAAVRGARARTAPPARAPAARRAPAAAAWRTSRVCPRTTPATPEGGAPSSGSPAANRRSASGIGSSTTGPKRLRSAPRSQKSKASAPPVRCRLWRRWACRELRLGHDDAYPVARCVAPRPAPTAANGRGSSSPPASALRPPAQWLARSSGRALCHRYSAAPGTISAPPPDPGARRGAPPPRKTSVASVEHPVRAAG
jgi:hypothetical protein